MCRNKKGKNNFKLSKELHEDNREFLVFFLIDYSQNLRFHS